MRALAVLVAAVSITACHSEAAPRSRDDHADVDYWNGCLWACPVAHGHPRSDPVATGGFATLRVDNYPSIAPFVVSSGDSTVLEVLRVDGATPALVVVAGRSEGAASLIFHDLDGAPIDELEMRVRDAAELAVEWPPVSTPMLLLVYGSETLYVQPRDAEGRRLFGFGSLEYRASTSGVVLRSAMESVTEGIASGLYWPQSESVQVTGSVVGAATIEARAPSGATLAIEIEVVGASAVGRIDLIALSGLLAEVTVSAQAQTASGEKIHGITCDWSVEASAGVTWFGLGDSITVDAPEGGAGEAWAEVTCTIGAESSSTVVTF